MPKMALRLVQLQEPMKCSSDQSGVKPVDWLVIVGLVVSS